MKFRIVIGLFILGFAVGSRYNELKITTPKSPYSEGESAPFLAPAPCPCGPNAVCVYKNGTRECVCKESYEGSPPRCRPSPELWDACFQDNPCGLNSNCALENGTRVCECLWNYEGSPPNCQPAPVWETCGNRSCGHNAGCDVNFVPPCYCHPGFVGDPPNCKPGPELHSRCFHYPCGPHSDCEILGGTHPVCSCKPGFVGAPPNCTPDPVMWRVCFNNGPCGLHSECTMEDKAAVCSPCTQGYRGEPPFCF